VFLSAQLSTFHIVFIERETHHRAGRVGGRQSVSPGAQEVRRNIATGRRDVVQISGRVFCDARRFFARQQSPSLFEHPPPTKDSFWMGRDKPGGAGGGKGRGAKRARVFLPAGARWWVVKIKSWS